MTITAQCYDSNSIVYTESVYQHDKNVTIVFEGIDLPEKYEVHFSNQKERGISVACEGGTAGVQIPDELLSTGEYVYAWIFDAGEGSGNHSKLMITIPVIPRPIPVHSTLSSESGSGGIHYEVDEEEENATFFNKTFNRSLENGIEEEN